MRLYTRTGDEGKTSIIGGRVPKDDIRVEAYGTTDELNSFIGLAIAELDSNAFKDIISELEKIQHEIFDCGGDLAILKPSESSPYKVTEEMITFLEERIDEYMNEAPKIEKFILPGGAKAASILHICRTVTRRAERCVSQLVREAETNVFVLKYLNRLSDYFFAVARVVNVRLGVKDIEYERSRIVFRDGKSKEN